MFTTLKKKAGFLSLLGLIFTLAIICFLVYVLINTYFKMPQTGETISGNVAVPELAVPGSSYHSIVDKTRDALKQAEKERQKQLDSLGQ